MLTWVEGKYNTSSCHLGPFRLTVEYCSDGSGKYKVSTSFGNLGGRFADSKTAKTVAESFARKAVMEIVAAMGGKVEWPPVVPVASGKS